MRRWLSIRLLSLLLCALVVGPVRAAPAGGVVGDGSADSCNAFTLATALSGGGSVTFNCGGPKTILLTAVNPISANTTLDGGSAITLTGSLTTTTRLFSVNPGVAFTLKNIVLDNGYASDSDGGAIANSGTLTLQNTTIQNSKTDVTHSGGALFSDGPVSISNSHLLFNTAGSGGALFANGAGARVQVDHTNFSDNQAFNALTGYGGAILVSATAQLSLLHSPVELNQAYYGGGLFIAAGGVVTVSAHTTTEYAFQYNFAQKSGGAVYNQAGGRLTTVGANFDHNHVFTNTADPGTGGAIFSAGPLALYDTDLLYNAAKFGGGLLLDVSGAPASIVLDHTAFGLNTAAVSGGGLYASYASAWVTITSSIFDENSAGSAGGAIARHNAHLTILDSSFLGNYGGASPGGGGLWLDGSASATAGGAVQVLDSTFSGNHKTALGRGGGIYNAGAQANLKNVTLAENEGGLYLTGAVVLSTTNSVYWNDGYLNCDGSGAHPLSLGGNYSSDNSCAFTQPTDKKNVGHDPLGPRVIETADELYGIVYYLPLPADDLINSALPVCSPLDQRGAARPDACDKGAVELGGLLPRIFVPLIRK